jgi:hypothetical protein
MILITSEHTKKILIKMVRPSKWMMVNLGTATGGLNVTITSQVVGVYAPAERIEKLLFFSSTLREKIISVQCDVNEKKHYTRLG